MKILSILLILIASFGVVTEFKSDREAMESIPRYVVIGLFYVWGYLAQRYSEVKYKGGIMSISGVVLFGVGVEGLVSALFVETGKFSFSQNSHVVVPLLTVIFSISILLIAYGHKRHRKLANKQSSS